MNRRVLAGNVRFLAGCRRARLVDEAPLNHAFARVVDAFARRSTDHRTSSTSFAGIRMCDNQRWQGRRRRR
jgi:hypothetical protein